MIAARLAWEDEAAPIREQLSLKPRMPWPQELAVFERKPPDDPTIDLALVAFQRLGTERQLGFGVGPIPVTAIEAWATRRFADPLVAEFFVEALLVADREWLVAAAKKREQQDKQKPRGGKR